ncbi:MAG: triacylglycerol lipase [Ruminococcus sp.]|nr:triacylglycerol lipase [Ruminococcus sp.]
MKRKHLFPQLILTTLFASLVPLWCSLSFGKAVMVLLTVFLSLSYLVIIFGGGRAKTESPRLRRIDKGADLIWLGGFTALLGLAVLIWWLIRTEAGIGAKIGASVMLLLASAGMVFAGVVRVAAGSKQIKLRDYILLLCLWWCPVVNLFIFRSLYKTARREYVFEADKLELENARAESEICKTKYPVLMVHGIFFRDWQLLNYWGRVPATLIRNGAQIYYGDQQSAMSIKDSAEELKKAILRVIKETGAEKVNIIAHSKGGLDSRYAISCLGMDKYVATLTTINTPHKGCDMVDYLLDKLPDSVASFIAARYNRIFRTLGDTAPDFMAGVRDLSAKKAASYDELMPDSPEVSYRSVMSVMSRAGSAGPPLNIGYMLIKKLNGRSDGLVWEESAIHGRHTFVTAPKKRGISHGDMIDLFRENIEGFDVREFYAGIVSELKKEGW